VDICTAQGRATASDTACTYTQIHHSPCTSLGVCNPMQHYTRTSPHHCYCCIFPSMYLYRWTLDEVRRLCLAVRICTNPEAAAATARTLQAVAADEEEPLNRVPTSTNWAAVAGEHRITLRCMYVYFEVYTYICVYISEQSPHKHKLGCCGRCTQR